ncbi:MAG: SDR family oxidoreductase [Anaerolineales bacterium]
MARILITGASGLLGANLALEACEQHEVVGIVNHRLLREPPFHQVQINLLEDGSPERLIDEVEPDWVIHCAALAGLEACEEQPELAQLLNTEVPGRLARVARSLPFVHISTDAVFDGVGGNYTEEDAPNPRNVYGKTKLAGERAVLDNHPGVVLVRTVFFGWSIDGRRSLAEFFISNLSEGRRVPGLTDIRFCPLLANALAQILLAMLERELTGLYHVVASDSMTKHEFGVALARKFGLDETLIETKKSSDLDRPAPRSPNLTLASHKLVDHLGTRLPEIRSGIDRLHKLDQNGFHSRVLALNQGSKIMIGTN